MLNKNITQSITTVSCRYSEHSVDDRSSNFILFLYIADKRNSPTNKTLDSHITLCYTLQFTRTIIRQFFIQQLKKKKGKYILACNYSVSEISFNFTYLLKL